MTDTTIPAGVVATSLLACQECGAALSPSKQKAHAKRFCSNACRCRWHTARRREAIRGVCRAAKTLREVFAHLDDKEEAGDS